jgi:circadian clock protein KaiC
MALQDGMDERISTGMSGLDDILGGGFDPNRLYLVEGTPGSGKTTLALQFLLEGVKRGEKVLYITLSESESELRLVATRHGWSLDGVPIFQLVPPEASHGPDHEVTLFHPSEIELGETTKLIFEQVRQNEPVRVVFDSLSEMRLLAQNSLAIVVKSSLSSISLRAVSALYSCSTTSRRMPMIFSFIQSRMASSFSSSWRSSTERRDEGCA